MPHDVSTCPVRNCPLCDATEATAAATFSAHDVNTCDVPFCRLCCPDLPVVAPKRRPGRPFVPPEKRKTERETATITLNREELKIINDGDKGKIGMVRHYMRLGMGLPPIRPGPKASN